MTRKVAIGIVAVMLLASMVAFFWVRSVFAHDAVRTALESQISSAIGQPVSIDSIGASILPRVTVKLGGVSIGQPVRIRAQTLRLGTDFRALLSRRIVHGTVRLDGARVELPLPPLGSATVSTSAQGGSRSPVEIVSIDDIVLNNVEIVSGGRTLRGDIEVAPHDVGATLRKISLSAEDTNIAGTGEIKNLAGPVGEITLKAKTLNFTRLLDFFTAFSSHAGVPAPQASAPAAKAPPTELTLSLDADRATMGQLVLDKLTARARVTPEGITLEPIQFGVFGGGYKGTMALTAATAPTVRLNAVLSDIDVAAMAAFAGNPGVVSGRLSGRVDVGSHSTDPAGAMNDVRGTARVDIRNGVVKGLGLVKTIVVATSMRADATMPAGGGSNDEPFSRLGATLTLAGGSAHTSDLQFESPDVLMNAAGSFRLNGSALDFKGNVQLSDDLSRQAGRDLVRYTQDQGRVTLPVTITGSAQAPAVRIDVASLAGRALQNKAKEAIDKALKGLIR